MIAANKISMRWTVIIQAVARLFTTVYPISTLLQDYKPCRIECALPSIGGKAAHEGTERGMAIEYKRQELVLLHLPLKWRPINELARARKGAPSVVLGKENQVSTSVSKGGV